MKGNRDWKLHEEARRLRASGMTLKSAGAAIGVSGTRVSTMLREIEHRDWRLSHPDMYPAPWYEGLGANGAELFELREAGIDSREACMQLVGNDLKISRRRVVLQGYEQDMKLIGWSGKSLRLSLVNKVRAWINAPPIVPAPRSASAVEIERAKRLLERHGWRVTAPNSLL